MKFSINRLLPYLFLYKQLADLDEVRSKVSMKQCRIERCPNRKQAEILDQPKEEFLYIKFCLFV